jgi:catechol 2,3-dioxygenase-like lactoylglutathione lyase family enzyme
VLRIEILHHVSLPVTDVGRARRFYADVLGLVELPRPPFSFAGAWFAVGDRQLHLVVCDDATLRTGKSVDGRDIHFAIRVASYGDAVAHFRALGYAPDADDEMRRTREQPHGAAGFPQVFVLDPDRNVIEINAERLD